MKTSILLAACLAACAAEEPELQVESQDLNGDSWATTDDNSYSGHGASYGGIAYAAAADRVVVAGNRDEPDGVPTWIVRSAHPGDSFALAEAYHYAAGQPSIARRVAVDGSTVYVVGEAMDASGIWHLVTRRGVATESQVTSWTTIDDVVAPVSQHVSVLGMAVATGGDLYVGAEVGRRVIRHQSGSGWSSVGIPDGLALSGICTAGSALIAVGARTVIGGAADWSVWSWGGLLWANIDDFAQLNTSLDATACTATDTTLFVGGLTATTGDPTTSRWLVRSRALSGGTWASVDSWPSPYFGAPTQMVVGRAGRIYEIGQRGQSLSSVEWLVRRSGASGWLNSDVVDGTGSPPVATGGGIAYDGAQDRLFAAGVIEDASGVQHGLVRESE